MGIGLGVVRGCYGGWMGGCVHVCMCECFYVYLSVYTMRASGWFGFAQIWPKGTYEHPLPLKFANGDYRTK